MGALAIRDLSMLEGEPRLKDTLLAERLGFAEPRMVRKLIERNAAELEAYGPLHSARELTLIGSGAKRETSVYYLNEAQTLLICMFSRTAKAAEVRTQVIAVFMAWRRGETFGQPKDRLEPQAKRLEALNTLATNHNALLAVTAGPMLSMAIATGKHKRFPKHWEDLEVREQLWRLHRQCELKTALKIISDQFGPERTPSNSAAHRTWMKFDALKESGS